MEIVKDGTKKAQAMRDAYAAAYMTTLREAYPSGFSIAKEKAFDYCENLRREKGGYGLAIVSKNTFVFCAAFLYEDDATGETMLCYITPSHNYATKYDA